MVVALGSFICSEVFAFANYSLPYGEVGIWSVYKDPNALDNCFAHNQAGPAMLQLAFTEYDGSWTLRLALWGQPSLISGRIGFGTDTSNAKSVEFIKSMPWATYSLSESEVARLRSDAVINIQIERGSEAFSLTGSSAAMDMVLKCVRERQS